MNLFVKIRNRVKRFVDRLKSCRHQWLPTHGNGFGMTTQEECWKCGRVRHRILIWKRWENEEIWHDGERPDVIKTGSNLLQNSLPTGEDQK